MLADDQNEELTLYMSWLIEMQCYMAFNLCSNPEYFLWMAVYHIQFPYFHVHVIVFSPVYKAEHYISMGNDGATW